MKKPTSSSLLFEAIVSKEKAPLSVNHFLKLSGLSRAARNRCKNEDSLYINGSPASWQTLLQGGETISLYQSPSSDKEKTLIPYKLPLDIIYEDKDLIAINKPAGLLMHPTSTERTCTLANAIMHYYELSHKTHSFHPIHRLDKDTSGVVLIGKHALIQHAFSKERIHFQKEYLLIVEGVFPHEHLLVNAPIRRKEGSIIERCVHPEGKQACTELTRVSHNDTHTLLRAKLHTGRTHQIRVHLSYLGFPLAGDDLYGGHLDFIQRQALHAETLSFTHPQSKQILTLTAPLPQDIKSLSTYLFS